MAAPHRPDTARYYTVTHPDEQTADWKAFYDEADRLTAVTRSEVENELDIAYGNDAKQYLDVYGSTDTRDAPIYLFIHGGGFREGDRAHYGYIAEPLAVRGVVTVVPSYRLLPDVSYFDAVEDIRTVIRWIAERFDRRILVGGHSAGGILAAFVSGDRTWMEDSSVLGGLLSLSVAYDFTSDVLSGFVRERLGSDAAAASPVLNVRDPVERAVVAVGANEEKYIEPSRTYAEALASAGSASELMVLDGMGHDGTVLSLADPGSELTTRTLALLGR